MENNIKTTEVIDILRFGQFKNCSISKLVKDSENNQLLASNVISYLSWLASQEATSQDLKDYILSFPSVVNYPIEKAKKDEAIKFEKEKVELEVSQYKQDKAEGLAGFHHADGEKVELPNLKVIKNITIDLDESSFHVIELIDVITKNIYTYLGNSIVLSNLEVGAIVALKTTISHTEYKEEKQTRLKRPSLLKVKAIL